MTLPISEELRAAVANDPTMMVRLYDDRAEAAYVVIPEAVYERLSALFDENPAGSPHYRHIGKLIGSGELGASVGFADG